MTLDRLNIAEYSHRNNSSPLKQGPFMIFNEFYATAHL